MNYESIYRIITQKEMKIVALGIWDKLTDLDIYVDENVRKKKKNKTI